MFEHRIAVSEYLAARPWGLSFALVAAPVSVEGVGWRGVSSQLVILLFPFPDEPAEFGKRGKNQPGVARCRDQNSMAGGSRMTELLVDTCDGAEIFMAATSPRARLRIPPMR